MLKFRPAEIKYFQLQSSIQGPGVILLSDGSIFPGFSGILDCHWNES